MIRDGRDGVAQVSCRIIEVLGDEFDFMAFNSQFRVDQQETGPAHGFGGYYWGNIRAEVEGIGIRESDTTTPCESRLKNTWGYPVWMKARTVVHESHAELPGQTPYDPALTYFAHEIGHTWLAYAYYTRNDERRPLRDGSGHWTRELHAPAPFPRWGTENGSVMGGAYWREHGDGTFTPRSVRGEYARRRLLLARPLPHGPRNPRRSAGHVLAPRPRAGGRRVGRALRGRRRRS